MSGKWLLGLWAVAALAQQPILFPHNKHVALGMACLDCHSSADTRAAATIPSVRKCMLCHEKLATDRPEVKKLAAYAAQKREVPWQRVYGFEREALVKFRHAPHVRAKIDCTTCHGNIAQGTVAQMNVKHNMGTCVTCHRQNKASDDCAVCHY